MACGNKLASNGFSKALSLCLAIVVTAGIAIFQAGCSPESPDTWAPERTVIDRTADWQGALLFITDATGPEPGWGSVRIYDNVSGFVEKTVEQTAAANPADVYVSGDGSSMYVAGAENGRIDKFRWDGNNWIRGGVIIETPARLITAMAAGPDGKLYVTADDGDMAGRIYRVNTGSDRVEGAPTGFPALANLRGIAWSPDGSTAYLSGTSPEGISRLIITGWPSLEARGSIDFPDTSRANREVATPDGRFLYVMAEDVVYKVDIAAQAIAGRMAPSGKPETGYTAGALSADGHYLFVTGKTAGEDSTLYIIDLANESVVKTVKHISDTASGMQRVE